MRLLATSLVVLASISLLSCANLQTISRRTQLPAAGSDNSGKTDGLAIHLDAQQRLLVVNSFQKYCAEPSPDALAAYAASLGLGYSDPTKLAASLSQAASSSAGSIGLRTQSITIMRDALYRMCEAYSNGEIAELQVALLLRRSQDLTAVILAIEQLTGAVSANQIVVTGNASSSGSANLMSNQQLLDSARKNEEAKKGDLKAATDKRTELEGSVATKKTQLQEAVDALSAATDANRESLTKTRDTRQQELNDLEKQLKDATDQEATQKTYLDEATKVREAVENSRDAALTSVVAGTTTGGQFSVPVQRNQLDEAATEAIADAVQAMVFKVLDKNYTQDTCMDFLTREPPKSDAKDLVAQQRRDSYASINQVCTKLVEASIASETRALTATSQPDAATATLRSAMAADPGLRARLSSWLEAGNPDLTVTLLLSAVEYADLRKQAIKDLNIKQN